jgi:hypothetical protein
MSHYAFDNEIWYTTNTSIQQWSNINEGKHGERTHEFMASEFICVFKYSIEIGNKTFV